MRDGFVRRGKPPAAGYTNFTLSRHRRRHAPTRAMDMPSATPICSYGTRGKPPAAGYTNFSEEDFRKERSQERARRFPTRVWPMACNCSLTVDTSNEHGPELALTLPCPRIV